MLFANIFRKYKGLFHISKPFPQGIQIFSEGQVRLLFFKLLLLSCLTFPQQAAAQLRNEAFYLNYPVQPADTGKLALHLYALGFSRNNEYFGRFADGYTLFGYQVMPWVSYQPDKRVRVWAGVFARDDFGHRYFNTVSPVFRVQARFDSLQLIFGMLQGSLNHRLIEPLYDFERVMQDRIEEGVQIIYHKERFWADAWIDWERTIYTGDPFHEVVSGGLSLRLDAIRKKKFVLTLPLQMVVIHQGGQIDTDPAPLITRLNGAIGLDIQREVGGSFLHSYNFQPYITGYYDGSNVKKLPYSNGTGIYLNAAAYTKFGGFMVSYWQGNSYIPIKGSPIFSSYSLTYDNPGITSRQRRLLMVRLLNEIKVSKHLSLSLRLEPFYDFTEKQFDFSNSIYVNYRSSFAIWNKFKKRRKI